MNKIKNFNDYIMNLTEGVNKHTNEEYSIKEIAEKINKKFNVVFTADHVVISMSSRFDRDNHITFVKIKESIETFIKLEKELKDKNLIIGDVDSIELDTMRIKAKYTLKEV